MADTSEQIIILSVLILMVIIVWSPNSWQMRNIATVNDVEVEIETSRDNFTIGENFTATVYLLNNGSDDIWMNPINELTFLGTSLKDPEPITGVILLDWGQDAMIHIPSKSKIKLFERDFESQYSGEFLITCLGAKKTVFILESSQNASMPREMRTLKDIGINIYTPRQNYTLGENFTAIVFFVNNESEEVWVEAVSQYTINSYSLSHPEEGLSKDVHDTIDSEHPWIHIPANSRITFDYMYCKPQYTGEFRISCLGAEKTVLILEPDILPYENTFSPNETTAAQGPLGDLTRLNLTMNCDLPPTLEYVPWLKMERIPITNSKAEEIALNAFNFSDIEKIETTNMGSLAVVEGNKRLYFYGLNDVFYLTLGDKTIVEEWSEPEIRTIADEFLKNLYNYWRVPTEAHIEFNAIRPCYWTVHEDGTRDVNKIGARYNVKIGDISLYGPGADFGLSIANGIVYDVELHIPSVFIEEYTDLPLSPQEALDRFLAGNYSIEVLGFTTLYGAIPREGQLTIEKVELVYFINHHSDPPQTYPPLCYMISGTIIGPDPVGDEIISRGFHELIPVT